MVVAIISAKIDHLWNNTCCESIVSLIHSKAGCPFALHASRQLREAIEARLQVELQPNRVESCLVPIGSLMNHSNSAHITNYGRLEADSGCLSFRLARSCACNEECFLLYGRLPNLSLLQSYGFAIKDNPHDTLPLALEVSKACDLARRASHLFVNCVIPKA